jgi:hypothetical protein
MLHTVAPSVPSNDREEKEILEMGDIVRGIDSNEAAIPDILEHVHLEAGLHAQDKGILLQS